MIQKFYVLLVFVLLFSTKLFSQEIVETNYYKQHPELGGCAVILNQVKTANGKTTMVSFDVTCASGKYYAKFWLCPTKLNDGTFASYDVALNGKHVGKITPSKGDWQYVFLNNQLSLESGKNEVRIVGMAPDVPNVEHVCFSKTTAMSVANNSTSYDAYKSLVKSESSKNADSNLALLSKLGTDTLSSNVGVVLSQSDEEPLYNYSYVLNANINYTFYKTVSFNKGQQVFIATNGIDNFSHVLEFFSATDPTKKSWSVLSNSNCLASLNITIPETDLYYVRVRSYLNGRSGQCNLNINGENYYEAVPVYSLGLRCTQETDQVYNSFTCCSTGDPRMWVEEGSAAPGKIYTFNDDYSTQGSYSWGRNSRIKMQFLRPVHSVLLSTYSSYNPSAKCDLYVNCRKGYTSSSAFPNLKEDDAIQSSSESRTYNCISWSGGITSYWEWPLSVYSSYYSTNPLEAFDNFYSSRGLTRVAATEDNAVVDLWANVSSSGSRSYTHASVRKGADGNAHGYDWESKLGALMRIFHPRKALEGNSYGQVVEHYIKVATQTQSLEEEIADGNAVVEYVDFDENENSYICQQEELIDADVLANFNKLFAKWKEIFDSSIFSDPDKIADCQEYRELLSLCRSNDNLKYAVFNSLAKHDVAAIKLLEDLTLKGNEKILEEVKASRIKTFDANEVKIVRPVLSNAIDYVKRLLYIDEGKTYSVRRVMSNMSGISYSNSDEFVINKASGKLLVSFSLKKASAVSLQVIDLCGNLVSTSIASKTLDRGLHNYTFELNQKGVFLVKLEIDGHVNVKKFNL